MNTKIHLSRKLQALVPSELIVAPFHSENPLGKWNATLFYVNHKKCLLLVNALTKYTVIIDRVSKADFMNFREIFIDHLYRQLSIDEIKIEKHNISKLVGHIHFCETDNDQKTIGIQNYLLQSVEDWKYLYGHIDDWPFRKINAYINTIPYKQLKYTYPKEKMSVLIEDICKKHFLN
jgi:hypothetical protein